MNTGPSGIPEPLRFGDNFELDLKARQLRRFGRVVKLERIPLEVLILLVEKQGEIVEREEIVAMVWGGGSFLDTDNAINGAIRKIRQALKDNPEEPKYIQTITSKGYRFVADIREVPSLVDAEGILPDQHPTPPISPQTLILLAILLVSLAAGGIYVGYSRSGERKDPQQDKSVLAVKDPPQGKLMLAVLPLDNLTGDPNEDYFSDGLTEEMISHLGNLNPDRLGVIARTSVMQYKGKKEGLSRIGRELGVHYLLEGSVRRESKKLRIAVQLIDMKDETHIWAHQYDRESTNLLAVQNEIANEVANEIRLTLADTQQRNESPANRP